MELDGRTGLEYVSDGYSGPIRLGNTREVIVSQGSSRYSEQAIRSKVFTVSTAVAGVAPGTALSTTPPISLHNPLNSGKELEILSTSLGYVSGTLGAGTIVYAYVSPQATSPTGGAALTPVCNRLSAVSATGKVYQGSTHVSTPLILRPAYVLGAFLATTALIPGVLEDEIDGAFIVPPATAFVMQGVAAAGTSPLVLLSITWAERDQK